MIVSKQPFNDLNDKNFYYAVIKQTNNKLQLNMLFGEDTIDLIEINLEDIFVPYNRFIAPINLKHKFLPVFNYEAVSSSRDTLISFYFYNDIDPSRTFNLFFGATVDEFILISSMPVENEGAVVDNRISSEVFLHYCPRYAEKSNLRNARRKMLLELDPNDSLSYLESQVDILSQIIIEMVKTNPAVKKAVPQFDAFEAAFTATNLFNVKSVDKCLGEISETKSKVRNLQDEYYQATKDDYQPKQPPTLQETKSMKKKIINADRNVKEQDVFSFGGNLFDCDAVSTQRIAIAAQNALAAKLSGAPFEIVWTLADNSTVTLDADAMLGVSQALAVHAATVHNVAKEMKEAVDTATTQEEIDAIAWPVS